MRKIPTVFVRDPEMNLRHVKNEVTPGCEWVVAGEGRATQKFDGTCCLVRDGQFYKRHQVKPGKLTPTNFELVETDANTGKTVGWVPVGDGPEDKWHREAFDDEPNGTYELVGPKIQGNPEGYSMHVLIAHGRELLPDSPRDFDGLRDYLLAHNYEGIVWHHADGRMAKLKKKDFSSP